jgi:FkbM family methyltransferase
MLQRSIPNFLKIFLKGVAYRLYVLSEKFFRGPFDKYDFQTIQVFRRKLAPNSNCIDIGANAGHILREILKAAPQGKHIAFEPIPGLFTALQKRYGKRAALYDYALSDKEGTVSFTYYKDRPAVSGFKERKHLGESNVSVLTVQTKRLDDLVSPDVPVHLIKIDVEGAEWQVLQGAVQTLKQHKPIVLFETGLGGADEYNTTPEQLHDLFAGCGLSISVLEYYLKGLAPLSREEFCGQFYKGYNFFFIAYDATKN